MFCPKLIAKSGKFKFKDNYLQSFIWLPSLYYKYKCLQRIGNGCQYIAISYILLVLYSFIFKTDMVKEQDLLLAGIASQVKPCFISFVGSLNRIFFRVL